MLLPCVELIACVLYHYHIFFDLSVANLVLFKCSLSVLRSLFLCYLVNKQLRQTGSTPIHHRHPLLFVKY